MIGAVVCLFVLLAALGMGASVFVVLRLPASDRHTALACAVGVGVLGWLMFFLGAVGLLRAVAVVPALAPFAVYGAMVLRAAPLPRLRIATPGDAVLALWWLVLAGLDVARALVPPTDGDTLTYHFAFPQHWLELGRLDFVARAVDGAVPLLPQAGYAAVLLLGGETGLTLWVMATGWLAGLLVFVLARPYAGTRAAVVLALLLLSTPAVVYGATTGQVEVRAMLFTLVCWAALARLSATGQSRFAALAGLAAGFYAGSKYLGLLFVAAAGLLALARRGGLRHAVAFGVAALAAGFQWYVWNWLHTHDPVFPMGFHLFGSPLWSDLHGTVLREDFFAGDMPLERTVGNALAYPWLATFAPPPELESGRTGLGPLLVLLLPFALMNWRRLKGPLGLALMLGGLYFVEWFFAGASQRVRHLLPVYPLLLLPIWAAAVAAPVRHWVRPALVTAVLAVAAVQSAGTLVHARSAVMALLRGEPRDSYLQRLVSGYNVSQWLNAHPVAGGVTALSVHFRNQIYYVRQDTLLLHPIFQQQVELLGPPDPERFLRQLCDRNVSRLVVQDVPQPGSALGDRIWPLLADGRLVTEAQLEITALLSRTVPGLGVWHNLAVIMAVTPDACRAR